MGDEYKMWEIEKGRNFVLKYRHSNWRRTAMFLRFTIKPHEGNLLSKACWETVVSKTLAKFHPKLVDIIKGVA